jgi:hypothetical protein
MFVRRLQKHFAHETVNDWIERAEKNINKI